MHAIFAACKSANGSRGNTPFGLHSDKQVPLEVDEFGTNFSGTAQNKRKTYIPKLNSGAVARSTLYILVCYKNCANEDYLPKETLKWLVN
jgi:endonuclease I